MNEACMKTKLKINLDKLEAEYLEALQERTGKDNEDIIKLAIQALHEKLCAQPLATQPNLVPFTPAYPYPLAPCPEPSFPIFPAYPWETFPFGYPIKTAPHTSPFVDLMPITICHNTTATTEPITTTFSMEINNATHH